MTTKETLSPFLIFFLVLPSGISNGFISVVLPFMLSKNGFPVAITAGIVAVGVSANLWRFLWGPVVDITWSLRTWYGLGMLSTVLLLLLLSITRYSVDQAFWLTIIVFLSQVAATFTLLPVNGFMAKRVEEAKKGAASGWYQAGSLAGIGFGGGAGLWMATHFSIQIAGIALCILSMLFALSILMVKNIYANRNSSIFTELKNMTKGLGAMVKIPITLYVLVLIIMPIGSGAMVNLWSAIASEWKAGTNTVVWITGVFSGLVSALGCVAGGYLADRWGGWVAYLVSGAACACITLTIAVLPSDPDTFTIGVLMYAFSMGLVYAAFTNVVLFASGQQHVATRFSLLCSMGNLPVVYMTAINGWIHDKYNSQVMLIAEAAAGVFFVIIFSFIFYKMSHKNLVPLTIEKLS